MNHEPREREYIIWQNRAFRFYLGSRLLYLNELWSPAAFCAQQALELLVKATLVYCDKSFSPKEAGHGMAGMLRTLKNEVKGVDSFEMSKYFFLERRYQHVSRYPSEGKGLGIPAQFLEDLDRAFFELVVLVPFQFNSELIGAVSGEDKANGRILEERNTNDVKVEAVPVTLKARNNRRSVVEGRHAVLAAQRPIFHRTSW